MICWQWHTRLVTLLLVFFLDKLSSALEAMEDATWEIHQGNDAYAGAVGLT